MQGGETAGVKYQKMIMQWCGFSMAVGRRELYWLGGKHVDRLLRQGRARA